MPLVVPGMQSNNTSQSEEWANKLMGKKLGDKHDEVTFARNELPEKHRVVNEGDMMTMDYNPDRLNVHVAKDGTVSKVNHG
ncbi:hypothetical protein K461DRAFT_169838 [Myriangium duriaei CBS 260.36]|uniref:Uncharacterized protein n=1 Tax=Myriangium duriaei CBS 260.36 TaxID=1168546 RepID=A0A9P4MFM3_9PEZI|nr:hypothetical protein K461DRAFT_169838 [Myriangium duriaei CBS 260.36]